MVAVVFPVSESETVSVTVPAAVLGGTGTVTDPPEDEMLFEPIPGAPK
jgi:hypothetical protein